MASDSQVTITPAPADSKGEGELSQQEQMQRMREKITDLETRISALNEKINLENGSGTSKDISREDSGRTLLPEIAPASRSAPVAAKSAPAAREVPAARELPSDSEIPTEVVKPSAATAHVVPTSKTSAKFATDENIDRFREAKIQYDSGRYSDSTVEFVAFTKDAPDHALAPAAQYFVGMGYLKQKEYARAEEEFNRGLVSYPHSNYVPDTLLGLLEVSSALKKPGRVTYYQQKLSSTFPNSPQAMRAALTVNHPTTEMDEPKLVNRPSEPEAPSAPQAPKADEPKSSDGESQ